MNELLRQYNEKMLDLFNRYDSGQITLAEFERERDELNEWEREALELLAINLTVVEFRKRTDNTDLFTFEFESDGEAFDFIESMYEQIDNKHSIEFVISKHQVDRAEYEVRKKS